MRLTPPLIIAAFIVQLSCTAFASDNDWQLAHQASGPEGISLYTRNVSNAQLKAFKGVTRTQASFSSILALMIDIERMPEWFFRCQKSELLSIIDNEPTIHMTMEGFWPVADRDIVMRGRFHQDPETLAISFIGSATPNAYPKQKDIVRIPELSAEWHMTPEGNGWTRIELIGHANPGGKIPVWMANAVVTLLPKFTLKKFHSVVSELQYQDVDIQSIVPKGLLVSELKIPAH